VAAGEATADEAARLDELTAIEGHRILDADATTLFDVTEVDAPVPATLTVDPWVTCAWCCEQVMETRARRIEGAAVCTPCAEAGRAAA
jgi:formylmethanofuran dehydrogenase subunit E